MTSGATLRSPHRRRNWAVALLVAQVLATLGALGAACVEVGSILATWPVLATVGIALAIVSGPWMSWHALTFSLSAPMVTAFGALIIAVFRLGPHEADGPIIAILGIYVLMVGPFSIWLYQNVLRHVPPLATSPMRVWQFSMKSLLGLTTGVALVAGISAGLALEIVFSLFGFAAIAASAFIAWRFSVARRNLQGIRTTELALHPPAD